MKTKSIKVMLMVAALFTAGFMSSCSDDEKAKPADDKTALLAKIDAAEDLHESAVEGTLEGQYPAGAKPTLQTAITAAIRISTSATATQGQVNSATQNLQTAMDQFLEKAVAPIDEANLVARWRFDEGTGTTAGDDSDNNLDGTFKTGHAFFGAGNPVWAMDRHGDANKAIYFKDGAHVEVPYNAKLNPDNISISLWMKQDVNDPIVNDQYMVAMNRWNGYKFNMQQVPKPFFTVNPQEAINSHINRDADKPDAGLPQGNWYHLVVTFGAGHMKFYVNGTITKDWADFTGTTIVDISANPINLTIGQDLPTNKYTETEGDFYVNWGGRFIGVMDEVRIYKSVLTGPQVTSIYNAEKPAAD